MIRGKWRTLLLATAMFNLGFVIWFSFALFTGGIAEEFGLSVAELDVGASAAVWPFRSDASSSVRSPIVTERR